MFHKCRRFTALLLSVVMLVALVAVAPMHASASAGSDHTHNFSTRHVATMYYCQFDGQAEVTYDECSCGAKRFVIARATNGGAGTVKGQCSLTTITTNSGCSLHPNEYQYCDKCHLIYGVSEGGHVYTDHTDTQEATCTAGGYIRSYCACGAYEEKTTSPLGHQYETYTAGGWDCKPGQKCTRCGDIISGQSHVMKYINNTAYHSYQCTVCGHLEYTESHKDSGDGTCVCGYKFPAPSNPSPAKCPHTNRTYTQSLTGHKSVCVDCGQTFPEEACTGYRADCTQPSYCTKCGRQVSGGQKNHNWGSWTKTADGHERSCRNLNCQAKESGPHDVTSSSDCTKAGTCSICGYRVSAGSGGHNWSSWTSNGSGAHTRYCLNPGCTAQQSGTHTAKAGDCGSPTVCEECGYIMGAASDHNWGHWENGGSGHYRSCLTCDAKQSTNHSGGTATCTSAAICSGCGASYGSKNPNNHAGGTELRYHKEPEVGKNGYTGDTYCLGCGALLQKGKETPALSASHTHSYGSTIHSDSEYHWKECACGHIEGSEAHTFKNGVCTVCGAADPNYVAPKTSHVHSTGSEYKSNETSHWKVCKDCNAAVDTAAHTYSGTYQYDETNHWRLCSVCGYKHVEAHDFQSGSCVVCGMKESDTSAPASPAPDASAKPVESAKPGASAKPVESAKPGASAKPVESAKPGESAKPVESAKPGASAKPVESAKPGESPKPAESAKPGESTAPNASAVPAPSGSAAPAPSGSAAPAPSGSTAPAPASSTAPAPETTPAPTPYIPAEPVKVEDLTDLDTEAEYYESVKTVVEQGIMSGTSADTFEPEATFTRAQVAAMLYNIAGKPEVENTATFSDMGQAKWATTAVSWAQSTGVVSGTGGNTFTPNQEIDRQTLAAILYNYAKANGFDTEIDETALEEVQDLEQAKSFFQDAMKWAVSVGLYTPDENGNVSPEEVTQRSMVAVVTVIFMRTENITVDGAE